MEGKLVEIPVDTGAEISCQCCLSSVLFSNR